MKEASFHIISWVCTERGGKRQSLNLSAPPPLNLAIPSSLSHTKHQIKRPFVFINRAILEIIYTIHFFFSLLNSLKTSFLATYLLTLNLSLTLDGTISPRGRRITIRVRALRSTRESTQFLEFPEMLLLVPCKWTLGSE
jgi:hypothetical protein